MFPPGAFFYIYLNGSAGIEPSLGEPWCRGRSPALISSPSLHHSTSLMILGKVLNLPEPLCSSVRTSSSLQKEAYYLSAVTPILPLHPLEPLIHLLSLRIYLFRTIHISGIIDSILCLASYTRHNVFEIYLCFSICPYFISFNR